jgi:hypothetical protein
MNNKILNKIALFISLSALFIFLLAGCAAKKQFWGDPKTGLILKYQMPKDKVMKYQFTTDMKQNLEVMGNVMKNLVATSYSFTTKSKGESDKNHLLEITVDSMKMNVNSPQGDFSPDLSSVIGKNFGMTLSSIGKELDVSGAEAIKYDMGPEGERSIVSDFKTIFPDLAKKPVKVGDSWTTKDTIDIKGGRMDINMTFESVNTLVGFETLDGMECIKVTAKTAGTMDGEGEQGGANMVFEGDSESSDTWYFAYKKGVFVKSTSEGTTDATIAVSGPQNMTIPMTMEMKFETKLVK